MASWNLVARFSLLALDGDKLKDCKPFVGDGGMGKNKKTRQYREYRKLISEERGGEDEQVRQGAARGVRRERTHTHTHTHTHTGGRGDGE